MQKLKIERSNAITTVLLCALVAGMILHAIALPLVISFDGQLYLDQARMLGEPRFWHDWHFLRTPLLQIITRVAFALFGQSAGVLIGINVCLALVGLILLFRILVRFVSQTVAAVSVLIVAWDPLFIAYQHTFLTEIGSFAFIMALILQLLRVFEGNFSSSRLLQFGVVGALAYYFRPTLLIVPFVAALLAVVLYRGPSRWRSGIQVGLCMAALPYLLSVPWKFLAQDSNWKDAQVIFGAINQALFEPESDQLFGSNTLYLATIRSSQRSGHLTSSGVADGEIYQFIGLLEPSIRGRSISWFLGGILDSPLRYAKGVIRGAGLLLGIPGIDSDNNVFIDKVYKSDGTFVFPGPASTDAWVRENFASVGQTETLAKVLLEVRPVYLWMYRLGAALLGLLILFGVFRRDATVLSATIIPLGFITYHAAVLFSLDRMAVPVVPLITSIPLVVLVSAGNSWLRQSGEGKH